MYVKTSWQCFTSKDLNSKTTIRLKGKALAPLGTCWRPQGISSRPLMTQAVELVYSFSWAKVAQNPNTSLARSGNKILWTWTTLQVIFMCVKHTSRPIYYGLCYFGGTFGHTTGHAVMWFCASLPHWTVNSSGLPQQKIPGTQQRSCSSTGSAQKFTQWTG